MAVKIKTGLVSTEDLRVPKASPPPPPKPKISTRGGSNAK